MSETDVGKFGLLNSLLEIANRGSADHVDDVLAKYFLRHLNDLDRLTVYDIAEECFTTRQQVRRFCKRIGLDSIRELRDQVNEWEYYFFNPPIDDYPDYLMRSSVAMMQDVNDTTRETRRVFCELIRKARNCVFLVTDIYTGACIEFQKQMLILGKMVRMALGHYRTNIAVNELTEEDLAITISISGRAALEFAPLLATVSAPSVLITCVHDAALRSAFDHVIYLSAEDQPQAKTAYHLLAIPYFLDLIQKLYRDTYPISRT